MEPMRAVSGNGPGYSGMERAADAAAQAGERVAEVSELPGPFVGDGAEEVFQAEMAIGELAGGGPAPIDERAGCLGKSPS